MQPITKYYTLLVKRKWCISLNLVSFTKKLNSRILVLVQPLIDVSCNLGRFYNIQTVDPLIVPGKP